jgi:hypothetical protein
MPGTSIETPSLPQRIRKAVASGEFPKARLLWEEYGETFRADRSRGPLRLSRLAEARELAEWTRMATLCARSHAQAKLNHIAVAQKYGCPVERRRTRIVATF